jgi:hypothetical protein
MKTRDLNVQPISRKCALPMIIERHYMHKVPPMSAAFGLFHNEILIGVVTYGVSASMTLRRGVCGDDESQNVFELTRLWTEDFSPKNAESYLISQSLKMLKKEIIITFAEIKAGHVGTIYQASNFIYVGLSAKRTDWKVKGKEHLHSATISDEFRGKNNRSALMRQKYGDDFYLMPRPRKHKYIYFNAKKKRRQELISKLKYKVQPYPKKNNENKNGAAA